MTHEDSLRENGYTVCSPISGSMKPLIRPHIDSAVFVPPRRIRKYDVALYRRNGRAIMHRVIGVRGDTCLLRGDNSNYTEEVPTGDIFGVMQGFYRGSAMWPRPRCATGCFPGAGCCSARSCILRMRSK